MSSGDFEWEKWAAETGFRRRMEESVARQRFRSETPSAEYLAEKRSEIECELNGKRLIYLDTKHWVNLCHIVAQSPRLLPIYDEILGLLEILRQKDRIRCPLSSPLFEELMKQSDPATRGATARIMDYLSGGVCIQNWLDLVRAEFGRHVCRTFHISDMHDAAFPIWTKVGYWAGEHTFEFPELDIQDGAQAEKVYIDLRWGMTCEEYQGMPDWAPTPDALSLSWLKKSEEAKSFRNQERTSFADLVRGNRSELLSALKDTILPMYALCKGKPGSPEDHVAAVLDPIYTGHDPTALPSVEVVAGLDAAIALDRKRKCQMNDLWDYFHAAHALPYCDALFTDNFMAQKMRNRPLEFGKIYHTEIGSRPEEIADYLKSLI